MKNKSAQLVILSLLYALMPLPIISFSIQGNLIKDLEKNDTSFITETSTWSFPSNPSIPLYSQCEGTYLLGGYNLLTGYSTLFRTYEELPPHDIIYYSVLITLIDGWDFGSGVVFVFGKFTGAIAFPLGQSSDFERNYCGDPNVKDLQVRISGKVFHQDENLVLQVESIRLDDSSLGYVGIRDVILHFKNKSSEDVEQYCLNAPVPLTWNKYPCPCQEGQYQPTGSSTCELCHPLCETCLGSSASQCLKCKDWAFFDGAKCATCHSSCATCFGDREDQCLTCPNAFYLFEGNRCADKCDPPLIQGTGSLLTCLFPCSPNEFLTPTGHCQETCEFGYNSVERYGKKFCNDYCPPGLNFVPPISTKPGSCMTECPSGTIKDATVPYCHHCQDSLCVECLINNGAVCTRCQSEILLNRNGICTKCDRMEISYLNPVDRGHQYKLQLFPSSCNPDPQVVQKFLSLTQASQALIPNTSFEAISPRPNFYLVSLILQKSNLQEIQVDITLNNLNGTIIVPKKLVPSEELLAIAELVPAAQAIMVGVVGVSFASAVAIGSTAAIWSIISFQQYVGYFIYINIDFPFQLEIFMSILGSSAWGFLPNPLAGITATLREDMLGGQDRDSDKYMPPQRFAKNDVTSFFIENGGSIIVINLTMHFALILLNILKKRTKSEHFWLAAVRTNLKWNVLARAFLENGIPLFVAVCLQLRVLGMGNPYIGISSVLTFIALIYFATMFLFLARYLSTHTIKELKIEVNQKLLGTLNEGIELHIDKPRSKYYHMLIFARGIVLILLIVFFEDFPMVQIVSLILLNIALIHYLFYGADFEDRHLGIVNKIKEALILIGEMFIFGLTFKNGSETHYETLGWLAVVCFSSALLIETVYMISVQIRNFRETKKRIFETWNAIKNWFKNIKAGRRNRLGKLQQRLEGAEHDESTIEMINN